MYLGWHSTLTIPPLCPHPQEERDAGDRIVCTGLGGPEGCKRQNPRLAELGLTARSPRLSECREERAEASPDQVRRWEYCHIVTCSPEPTEFWESLAWQTGGLETEEGLPAQPPPLRLRGHRERFSPWGCGPCPCAEGRVGPAWAQAEHGRGDPEGWALPSVDLGGCLLSAPSHADQCPPAPAMLSTWGREGDAMWKQGLCKGDQVQMRSRWVSTGSKCSDWCPHRRRECGHRLSGAQGSPTGQSRRLERCGR